MAFSFPKFSVSFLGFIFLIPLLFLFEKDSKQALKKKNKKQLYQGGFLSFFVFAFVSYVIILYWIPRVMVKYGGMGKGISVLGLLLLVGFLSLFHGVSGIFIKRIVFDSFKAGSLGVIKTSFLIPFIWVAKDLIIEKVFGGFPWCLVGYSQYENYYFIQVAEFGGVHLITFILIFLNVNFYFLLRYFKIKKFRIQIALVLLASFGCIYTIGFYLVKERSRNNSSLAFHHAGIIQPNTNNDPISQEEKQKILEDLLKKSKELYQKGAEFIIWPEHTVSLYPLQNQRDFQLLHQFAKENVPLIGGFTDFKTYHQIYNSAILFKKDGFEKYDKVHLTPFGEYILFRNLLFFVKKITNEISDFKPGESIRNLNIKGHAISTPICYEIIFTELVREFIDRGGELIVTISNDSWFGNTSAPYQHLAMATFRCIENRRYLLRSTTNGISAVVTPFGEILQKTQYNSKAQFIAQFKYMSQMTFFTRNGYLFPYFCLGIVFIYFCLMGLRKWLFSKD